jgi:hypothetical protein
VYSINFLNTTWKYLLGYFNSKVGREDIFKPSIGNEGLHEISNDNGVKILNFATSTYLTVKSSMFPHRNTHKFIWTSPDGKTHNQIYHILIDRRRHSSVPDVRSFRGADCDTDHYLVVAEVRERLAGHVARMGEKRNAYRILVGKPERKRRLGRPRRRWEENIKTDLREIGWGGMDWIDLALDRDQWMALVNTVLSLRVHKMFGNS